MWNFPVGAWWDRLALSTDVLNEGQQATERPVHGSGGHDAGETLEDADRNIFEPDPRRDSWDDVRTSVPPPRYGDLRLQRRTVGPPPSIEAAAVDRAAARLSQMNGRRRCDKVDVFAYLGAIAALIEVPDALSELTARAGPMISRRVVSQMSGMLQAPLQADASSDPTVSMSHVMAVEYCRTLAGLLDQGVLKGERTLLCISNAHEGAPLLLSLASLARQFPTVSHALCDLLLAVFHALPRLDRESFVREHLLMLSDELGSYGKYSSFCGRLVGDGRQCPLGAVIAMARLREHNLWPSARDIAQHHRSLSRANKHDLALKHCDHLLKNQEFQQILAHETPALEESAGRLQHQIALWCREEQGSDTHLWGPPVSTASHA